ncbi:MAG: D-alanyl-D-alanine carboxypeptidase/D-alanyl-D-alanine-endopeptidase [Prevotellaceae bacterium]|jgi:D-alanyl-D-alanine carboxypeptidase/D-alanyl-D-alanine-endopeptidase (penicillin-binding protein 4)|nr:D-alanyl-D-alanine carboxypeptidase/D-alanyl-D-alanine-endopeptidase [Prevotellaceae bacterium]
MKQSFAGLSAVLWFLFASVAYAQDSIPVPLTLWQRLDSLVKADLPPESAVSIAVYDLTARDTLYAYEGDKLCRPASTMKLLTAITRLTQPDGEAPFSTEMYYTGAIERDTLFGDVYIIGGFDPEFDDTCMNQLVVALDALPISVINGRVYGDVTMKDSLYWGTGWIWDDTPFAFQPYLSPLMFNKGKIAVRVTPNAVRGNPPTVECRPISTYYHVRNEALTRDPAAGRFRVTRLWLDNSNDILVTGNSTYTHTTELNITDSQDFFMHTFVERLEERGIRQTNPYGYAPCPTDSTAQLIARVETPMQTVLEQMLKESDNLNAEAMLCHIGVSHTGHRHISANDGLEAMQQLIDSLGHNSKNYRLADGSGLSNYDYVSPWLLTDFLRYAYSDTDIFRHLYKALPVAGIDGTLKNRMKGTAAYRRVHAKTGTITGVCTLAGYLRTADNHEVAFAIMNQNFLSTTKARALQDNLCALLCQ